MDHSLGALLGQNNDQGQEQAIYYLSRTMMGGEHRYNPVEKECLALIFAIQNMRHYLVKQTIHVISKAVKGQALADFLADHPAPGSSKLYEDLPDEVAEAFVLEQARKFKGFFVGYIPRAQNTYADALDSLETSLVLPPGVEIIIPITGRELYYSKLVTDDRSNKATSEEACATTMEFEPRDWRFPYIDYVMYEILPDNSKEAATIKRKALRLYYDIVS
ncbi:uncharacterized protein LOC109827598 [Asparagus officinalis]|uniref:uncharacterized protein LOC109827598 n=1 Tax=Asparagus officinalis TaxID=4686 RepID=UPI00098DFD30|nr:uncharacterized protein LOC109827598 [Asparagus officinalis]